MYGWVLKVELDGEWEECQFPSQKEAVMTFRSLAADYKLKLKRAILFAPDRIRARLLSAMKEVRTRKAVN